MEKKYSPKLLERCKTVDPFQIDAKAATYLILDWQDDDWPFQPFTIKKKDVSIK